jgi:peptidyl-prolyl cis-trans isomerase-like 3
MLTVMHSMMIRVIDGSDTTLESMEKVPVNPKNRPLHEIKLESVSCCAPGVAQTTDYILVVY